MRVAFVVLWIAAFMPAAAAEPARVTKETSRHRSLAYGELLGKAGPYGLGWEIGITRRLSFGVAGSIAKLGRQQLYTIAPYAHATLVRGGHHAMFGELGLVVGHSRLPSPVPEWDGINDTGAGCLAAAGWEWRPKRIMIRANAGAALGARGLGPFVGLAFGVAL